MPSLKTVVLYLKQSAKLKVKKGTKIVEEEQRETGHVSWKVYWLYITKAYGWYIILAFVYSSDSMADCSSGKWLLAGIWNIRCKQGILQSKIIYRNICLAFSRNMRLYIFANHVGYNVWSQNLTDILWTNALQHLPCSNVIFWYNSIRKNSQQVIYGSNLPWYFPSSLCGNVCRNIFYWDFHHWYGLQRIKLSNHGT